MCRLLDEMLQKNSIVVFYDLKSEFKSFFDNDLPEEGKGYGDLPRVALGERLAFLVRYSGSFFEVRAAVEPIVSTQKPDPLIIYLPGVERDRQSSVLMEIEKGGTCFGRPLTHCAKEVLGPRFTEEQVNKILDPTTASYDDIVSLLAQSESGGEVSVFKTLFGGLKNEDLIASWLADSTKDDAIQSKDAIPELHELLSTRLGLDLPTSAPMSESRERTVRHVLLGEFRSDLKCSPPLSISMLPFPKDKEQVDRLKSVAGILRKDHADRYVALADTVATDLNLDSADIKPPDLGSIDTFRFEERRLLGYAGGLTATGQYAKALDIVADRTQSFWVDREVSRHGQWEMCRLVAELGLEIYKVRSAVDQMGMAPRKWVDAYVGKGGWHQVDLLQRHLETWAAKMDDEPETETALAIIRQKHEQLLKNMADGFSNALHEASWTVPRMLHQTRIYPEVVQTMGRRTAYFFVDALRYEMGVDLARQLQGAKDVSLRPAIAALPSITPVGMAALLPGASASFSVIDHKGKLAATIEGTPMPGLTERLKFLKAKVPDVVEVTLGRLVSTLASKLGKLVGEASIIVVRSQEID